MRPVSIHAPARGATPSQGYDWRYMLCFNPRARAGRDVSTKKDPSTQHSFNPRARAGRDLRPAQRGLSCEGFNPRARAGRDSSRRLAVPATVRFNPRARAGRDLYHGMMVESLSVSIHAPARGATLRRDTRDAVNVFQSTRPRGARHLRQ